MNTWRVLLAAIGGTVAYFAFGFAVFGALPVLRNEYAKYPAVFRTQESMKLVMPVGMLGMFVAIFVLSVLFAMLHSSPATAGAGALFGVLIGIFAICSFVLHNYVNLNVGLKLTVEQAVAYFLEWVLVGTVIGLIYKPVIR